VLEKLNIAPDYDGFLFLAESVRNPPMLKMHRHRELELNLVVAGEISYVVDGKRYTFSKRSLLWMFPSQDHQLVDRSDDAEYYVAVFTPEMIASSCRGERYRGLKRKKLSQNDVLSTVLAPDDFDLIRRSMDDLAADGIDPDLLNREAGFGLTSGFSFRHNDPDWLNAGLHHLLLQCWRCQLEIGPKLKEVELHITVRKALDLLAEGEDVEDLNELARLCGVSGAYLSRLFKTQIGVSLTRYRNSVRLSRFWENYRQGKAGTLLEAVYAAGFGSYAQFYRVYREVYGTGPRESMICQRGEK
jgi:AraC-like DNA-binding protein